MKKGMRKPYNILKNEIKKEREKYRKNIENRTKKSHEKKSRNSLKGKKRRKK